MSRTVRSACADFIMASNLFVDRLLPRHIQDHTDGAQEKYYWGYPSRVVPCKNDPGSCAYLDGVYWMHTVSMLYTFILWAVIGALLLLIVLSRLFRPKRARILDSDGTPKQSILYRS